MLIRTPATGIREDQDPRWSSPVSEETDQHHQADYFSFTLLVLNLRFGSEAGWKGEKRKEEEECLKFCFLWCKPQTSQRFLIPHQRLNGSRSSSKLQLQFSRTWKSSRTIRVEDRRRAQKIGHYCASKKPTKSDWPAFFFLLRSWHRLGPNVGRVTPQSHHFGSTELEWPGGGKKATLEGFKRRNNSASLSFPLLNTTMRTIPIPYLQLQANC